MKQQSEQADRSLDDRIPYKRTAQPFAVAPDENEPTAIPPRKMVRTKIWA